MFAFGKGPGKVEVDPDGPAHSGIDRHDRYWNRDQRVVDARNPVRTPSTTSRVFCTVSVSGSVAQV